MSLEHADSDEIQGLFVHVFNEILKLINGQIHAAAANTSGAIKVPLAYANKTLFLVGGLGSNSYLYNFLQDKLKKSSINILQPEAGYSSIMRGAVLHKLDLNIVKRRTMRKCYGWSSEPKFNALIHPKERRRYCKVTGEYRCTGMLQWCAKTVSLKHD
jgi:hypothetical protein